MLRDRLNAAVVSFLIVDFTGSSVVRLGAADSVESDEPPERVTLPGTLYADALRTQRPALQREGNSWVRVVAPVTDRGDAIGLLELFLPEHPDDFAMRQIGALNLAAEIQHRLLPTSLACEAAQFTVAGALEPATHVGGDTFDYVVDRDTMQLSVTDAMGHDVEAALLATLAVCALRRPRRAGAELEVRALEADRAVIDHGRRGFVTGQLLRISLLDGTTQFVNAGHPWPLRLRRERVEQMVPEVDLPFGIQPRTAYRVQRLDLQPGDRLVMLTDGMLERRAVEVDLPSPVVRRGDLHLREASRALVAEILRAHGGRLQDEAAVMCLDWHGTHQVTRSADAGADLAEASAPEWHSFDDRGRRSRRAQSGQVEDGDADDSAARRYSALMRWASSSWSSRMMMRQAASMGVPWSTSSRARAAMRSW